MTRVRTSWSLSQHNEPEPPSKTFVERIVGLFRKGKKEPLRLKHKRFKRAINCMNEHKFKSAFDLLNSIEDYDVAQYKIRCEIALENASKVIGTWTLNNTLSHPEMRDAFELFCRKEINDENLRLWMVMQEFQNIEDPTSRRQAADVVMGHILKEDVNIAKLSIEEASLCLKSSSSDISADIFKEIQTQLLMIMSDSHKRFKEDVGYIDLICTISNDAVY